MKYCTKCDAPIDDNATYCTKCGAAQDQQASNPQAHPQAQAPYPTMGIYPTIMGIKKKFKISKINVGVLIVMIIGLSVGTSLIISGIVYARYYRSPSYKLGFYESWSSDSISMIYYSFHDIIYRFNKIVNVCGFIVMGIGALIDVISLMNIGRIKRKDS